MGRGAKTGKEGFWVSVRGTAEQGFEASQQGRRSRITFFAHIVVYTTGESMKLEDHPTVKQIRLKTEPAVPPKKEPLDAAWLKQLVLDAGADDAGFVEIGRPALDDQREDILKAFPHTKTLISFVVRMNREAIRTPARSVANLEFHHSGDEVNEIARSVVQTL